MQKKYRLGMVVYADRPQWSQDLADSKRYTVRLYHRYVAIGIQNKAGFTGTVYDYTGGGNYETHLFVDDTCVSDIEDYDYEDAVSSMVDAYPGLLPQIAKLTKTVATYSPVDGDEGMLVAPAAFARKYLQHTKKGSDVYCAGAKINPKMIGLTVIK